LAALNQTPSEPDQTLEQTSLSCQEFWKSMPEAPHLHEWMRMKLYHLMGGAKVLGYIKTELYILKKDESIVSFELESYVV